ncbi:putative DNA primase/helicase [Pseudomonas sp. 8Z]|uniref:bifunctional DNA primase/polymerase n=1 Tax=Pseudomonas sp. 8Z TaxID=2653166 RepID=UPI0012F00C5E|nr:bifunctional DNA primase/polymerase [Pseudomonas sp. 8Z]VXC68925.1 putative DNA primase/helicase [Pseudomonas sp. 8Z]
MTKLATPKNMAAWARRYIEVFNLALVSIDPGEKAPKGNGWNKPGGYITDADQAEAWWTKHPNHNMGVVLGPSRVCSLDVDHVEYCRQVFSDVLGINLDDLAAANPTLVGNPARFRIMFRLPEGLEFNRHSLSWPNPLDPDGSKHKLATAALKQARETGNKDQIEAMQARQKEFAPVTVFELRAGAVQDVLPPSIHPDTGQPYTWRNPPTDGLPELPSDLVKTWQLWDIFKRTALEACPWAPAAPKPPAKVKKSSPPRKEAGDHPSVIDSFNRATDIETLLQRHGYIKRGRKWLAPQSSTGLPGVSVVDEQGEQRLYSHHGSDPLANGHMNDAFDVFCILEHNGDTGAAIKAAARELGMEHKRSAPRPPEPPPVGDLPPAPTGTEASGEPGSSDNGGAGEGLSLKALLRRYALIEGTTHVWDIDKAKKMKRAAFEAHVGKDKFKEWSAVTDSTKKRVSEEWVRDIEQARTMAGKAVGDITMPPLVRYVYIDGTKDVWDYAKKRRIAEGAVKMSLGDAYSLWLNSPERRVVDMNHIVFDPTMTHDPAVYINTFEGLPLEPANNLAACENLRWLIAFLCNHEENAVDWLTRWLAYPLQHTGAKMDTAVLMHSIIEGSGKSLLFSVVMGMLYGQYSATVGQTQLEGNFNAWQSGKLWAVFEEVVSRDQRYNQVGKIKQLITGQTVRIESKFVNGWEEASHMNAVFLSNEIMPWPISDSDRRFLVMWPEEKLPADRQKAIKHELANGGVEALYGWLLGVDLGDFDPQTKPPVTPARERLVALSRASWQTFLHLWQAGELGRGLWGACLSTDIYALFLEWCHRNKEHSMSQTKFSLFISTAPGMEKTRAIPWSAGLGRRFGAFFFPSDEGAFLPPSTTAAALGKHVEEWRERARLGGWAVDSWDHVKAGAA